MSDDPHSDAGETDAGADRAAAADGLAGSASDAAPTTGNAREAVETAVLDDVRAWFDAHEGETVAGRPTDEYIDTSFFDFDYLDDYAECERHWVAQPFAYVTVLYDDSTNSYRYHVVEPALDEFEEYVREDLIRVLRSDLMYRDIDEEADRATVLDEELPRVMADHAATVADGTLEQVAYYLRRDVVGYGKVDPVMRDGRIEDISCDGADTPLFVYHHEYRDLRTNLAFEDERLNAYVVRLAQRAGKHLSVADPLVDARLPDGSRVQLTLGGEVTTRGSNFTIRKFAEVPFTPIDLIEWNTFSLAQMAYLWLAVENRQSLLVAGGTGSGKTTTLNALSLFIPPDSKVVSIEDTPEITLPHDNWIQSVTREAVNAAERGAVDMFDLLQSALRQRPEFLVVGEIRTESDVAHTFFQSIATGHTAYTTFHADTIGGMLSRLENEPLNVPPGMIANLDLVAIQQQVQQGEKRVRRNRRLAELDRDGSETGLSTSTVFEHDAATDAIERVGESTLLDDIARERGWSDERLDRALGRRREVLEHLVETDTTDYEAVTRTIRGFMRDPEPVVEAIRDDRFDPTDLPATGTQP
ncbi:type II/IV secretion system ATPase subunit [Halosimplex pelagicum]|uniref:Type II/IV secretion system ATPase subunit n=1 Tax=Halosimplex pelagicum TaxID=869886 RepID=A0A7D5PED5_9EURY|nr:type II/IV secretion system ATPase subunit [Halosimplex pelagicum]QLH81419.1 type II/IV secretion system ATPase subunit [Halosimplex pelagicum]